MPAPAAPPTRPTDPRLLIRAAGPGRVRGIALEAYREALRRPRGAGGVLRQAMREARALHSQERRFVTDSLFDLVRHEALLDQGTGVGSPLARWLGWLVHLGLPVDEALAAWSAEPDAVGSPSFAPLRLPDGTLAERLALAASVPVEVAAELAEAYGEGCWDFLEASNARAPVGLRVHRGRRSRESALSELRSRGLAAEPGRFGPDAVLLPTGADVNALGLYRDGTVELQDEGSQLVVELVDPLPGDRVWDVCAGAGGKTLALAARRDLSGRLVASDVRGPPLGELQRRAQRAGFRGIRCVLLPEQGLPAELGGPFDRVLVDAPCSGSGVWRRHPELRWRLSELDALRTLQADLLDRAADRVAPGGRLVYATCSVLPSECERQVASFLRRREEFHLVPARQVLPPELAGVVRGPYLRTSPHEHGTDGFFGAVLQRLG